jgi:hypothetical protein
VSSKLQECGDALATVLQRARVVTADGNQRFRAAGNSACLPTANAQRAAVEPRSVPTAALANTGISSTVGFKEATR